MKKYKYKNNFFINEDKIALKAASKIVPYILKNIEIKSVIDVGCGTGSWLYIFKRNGIVNILGLDSHKNLSKLKISQEEFINQNLENEIISDKFYDLAISLEVAEHINPKQSINFISDLCRLSDIILFSAATPGQGGENHINEKNLDYWRVIFRENGYYPYDVIRNKFESEQDIAPWYRFNTLLYVNEQGKLRLSRLFSREFVSDKQSLKSYETFFWRLRRLILKNLPRKLVNFLSKINTIISNLL